MMTMFLATTVGVEGLVVAGLADLAGKIAYDIYGTGRKLLSVLQQNAQNESPSGW